MRPTWNSDTLRGKTDRVAKGKYDKMEEQDIGIVRRVNELAEKHQCKMSQIAIAWQWAKGVASPIIGATKMGYLDELYVPHPIVGAIDKNPAQGVILLDEKK